MAGKKILAVRNDRLGEFLLNIPALRALKESLQGSRLTLVVSSSVKDLAQDLDCVDEVIVWENRKHKFSEVIRFSRQLKNRKFDICVIFNPSKEFNIISFMAGVTVRLGYNRKWGFLLTHKIEDRKYLGQKHEVEYNLELVGLIGVKATDKRLYLNVDGDILGQLSRDLGINNTDTVIAVHPWTSDPVKQWPVERFSCLASKLLEYPQVKVVIVGGQEEITRSNELFAVPKANLINMTGKTSLKELAALLKICRVLVSGDSGPVHLACSVGTPVIAIFRNDIPGKTPTRWGPWGKGHRVIQKENLSDITVDEVLNGTREVIGR